MASTATDRAVSPLPPVGHDIPRSSHYQPKINHGLPALSTLASVATNPSSQIRAFGITNSNNANLSNNYTTSSPGATTGGPFCQNCKTFTTPLWRRDEIGSVLCNACGLFLKLHGSPRPISLKTDVIKSRNRVKTATPAKKRSHSEVNQNPSPRSEAGTPSPHNREASRKPSSGGSERSITPASRTDTPSINHPINVAPQHVFDGGSAPDHTFQTSASMPSLHTRHLSPISNSSPNDRHLEPPMTYDELLRINTTLKTRVSELEVINDLFQGRVAQLERSDANARHTELLQRDADHRLRQLLEQAQARENELKRQVDDLKQEVAELKGDEPHIKRQRFSSEDAPKSVSA